MASSEVQRFLDEYPSLKYDKEKQKVTCDLTKHEMPATAAAIESYVKGRKFKNAFKKDSYNYDQHKPHIVASNKKRHLHELFCSLTLRHIAKTPEAVERHVKGKRFRKALARWQSCQETGEKFTPRGGQRNSNNARVSDNDSVDGGDDFWMNDSDDEVPNDDMSDLYPDLGVPGGDPESDDDDGSGMSASIKKLKSVKSTHVNAEDSDSDYDMAVLDETEVNIEVRKSASVKKLKPVKVKHVNAEDSDSDYDMAVLNEKEETEINIEVRKSASVKKLKPVKVKHVNAEDSDSDYDMAVLNEKEETEANIEVSTAQLVVPSQNKRKKKKNKQMKTLPAGSSEARKTKQKETLPEGSSEARKTKQKETLPEGSSEAKKKKRSL